MAIPDFQSWFLPFLRLLDDKEPRSIADLTNELPNVLRLSEEDKREKLPSGRTYTYKNRAGWARTYLNKAGLIESPSRGIWQITTRGLEVLSENPDPLNVKYLKRFPEFAAFHEHKTPKKRTDGKQETEDATEPDQTPEEQLELSHKELRDAMEQELLEKVLSGSPDFFEELVVELLLRMGYGNFRSDSGTVVGGSGDGGIDGVINEDKLGLDIVYIQAKRWKNSVGSEVVRNFAGSLDGVGANKGVLITTSTFVKNVKHYVDKISKRIVLIDGEHLAKLMFEHDLGATTASVYHVKKIDSDFFDES